MSRINTNVTAMISARILGQNNKALGKTLEALSTGLKINRGSDDPAGLIASESLRSDMAGIKASIANAERASGIVSTAEGALGEISDKLIKMQALVGAAASTGGLTQSEIDANQTQVDGIISSINRIANETSFMGAKLLDGSKGFKTTTGAGDVTDVSINMAKGVAAADLDLDITVVTAATEAVSAALAVVEAGAADDTVTYEITGSKGTATVTFGDATTVADVATAINALSSITGLMVSTDNTVRSVGYGADEFVRIEIVGKTDPTATHAGLTEAVTEGTDAVVTINGAVAAVDGYNASLRTETVDVSFTMTDNLIDTAANTETITIENGGGATFQLSPNVGMGGQETIGINAVQAYRLGNGVDGMISDLATGGTANLTDDASTAQKIVTSAIKDIATMRGRLGSFLNDTVDSAVNSMNVALENVSAAESLIRDTDFATATADLTRNQVLVAAANSVLSIAGSTSQSVLSLL